MCYWPLPLISRPCWPTHFQSLSLPNCQKVDNNKKCSTNAVKICQNICEKQARPQRLGQASGLERPASWTWPRQLLSGLLLPQLACNTRNRKRIVMQVVVPPQCMIEVQWFGQLLEISVKWLRMKPASGESCCVESKGFSYYSCYYNF